MLASTRGLLGLEMLWACVGWGVSVLFVTLVVAGVSKGSWDSEEVRSRGVTAGEATGLEEGLVGNSRLGRAGEGVV